MADNMEEELKKLKVPELKQALKDKGLSTTGTKPDLIKRLVECGASGDSADPVLDEDEILKDDSTPVVAVAPAKPASVPAIKAPNATNGAKNPESTPGIQMAPDTTVMAQPSEVKKLTEAERLKMRADKFGITSEQDKKQSRAERFGVTLSENKSGNISSEPVDLNKLKARADRFGVSTSSVTEDEKKRKRAERFGSSETTSVTTTKNISLNSTDSDLEAKKRKRAERFGLT